MEIIILALDVMLDLAVIPLNPPDCSPSNKTLALCATNPKKILPWIPISQYRVHKSQLRQLPTLRPTVLILHAFVFTLSSY